jgi:hypothetical protein
VHRVDLQGCPDSAVTPLATRLARLEVASFAELTALLRRRGVWPIELTAERAREVLAVLEAGGCRAGLVDVSPSGRRCAHHPALAPDGACARCGRAACVLCLSDDGRCDACRARREGASRRQLTRLVPLSILLGVVVLAGLGVMKQRARRRSWERPLRVTVVLAGRPADVERVRDVWGDGLAGLTRWFDGEAARYGLAAVRPVEVQLADEACAAEVPRVPAPTGSLVEDVRGGLAFRRALARVAPPTGADLTLVVALRARPEGTQRFVEGATERFGAVGLVEGTADETDVALELVAVAHEVLHAVGADDAYDAEGRPVVPAGLVDPSATEQRYCEVMAGAFPAGADHEVPRSLDEVRVGPATARAVGWLR